MSEIKKTIKLLGHDINVVDVPIKSAIEFFNEYELEDGSKIKVKCSAASFVRVEGEFAPDGKPIYLVFTSPALNVLSSPEGLMRQGPQQPKKPN
jgi:hypothetical protein